MGRVWAAAVLAIGLLAGTTGPALARGQCLLFTGTADGLDKGEAVDGSRDALNEEVTDWKKQHHVTHIDLSPFKPHPKPYWRTVVTSDLYVRPDVVSKHIYTLCWHGVVSPVVCTSGARYCHH